TTITLDTLDGMTIQAPNNMVNTFEVQSMNALMPLTLTGGTGTGSDTLTINDAAASATTSYEFDAGKVVRSVPAGSASVLTGTVNYGAIDSLVIKAGSGNDTFKMTDTTQPTLTLNGGGGKDEISYAAFTSNVTVNLAAGTANKVSSLSNVENATGGTGNDILV